MRLPFAALFGLLVVGCTPTKAQVQCQGVNGVMNCTVQHVQGDDTVNVCFDAAISCRNGKSAVAHACQVVSPGSTATKVLQDADFANSKDCEPNGMAVNNITLTKQ